MSSVLDNSVWWHVYPLGFTGAAIRPYGESNRVLTPRLARLEAWLDYLIEFGANGLALGPIFESETHGYDTTDYFHIDPRLGDDSTFDGLVKACEDRGISLMLDGVFNHVGAGNPLFVDAIAGGKSREMFQIDGTGDDAIYRNFEGHEGLPALNHESERVVELVVDVMSYWLRRGASAWRLDAAYAVPNEFWAEVLPRVRAEFPSAAFVGEVIHGDYSQVVSCSGMDSVTQYELWKALWSSLLDGNFFELDWCLQRHNSFLSDFTPFTFIGNHDVTRIASKVGDASAALAAIVQLTVGGHPAVYYGDERAYRGVKTERLGGDDEVRPPYPVSPAEQSPLGEPMFRFFQQAIAFRRRFPWLARTGTRTTHLNNRSYAYELSGPSGELVSVYLDLDPTPNARVVVDGNVELSFNA